MWGAEQSLPCPMAMGSISRASRRQPLHLSPTRSSSSCCFFLPSTGISSTLSTFQTLTNVGCKSACQGLTAELWHVHPTPLALLAPHPTAARLSLQGKGSELPALHWAEKCQSKQHRAGLSTSSATGQCLEAAPSRIPGSGDSSAFPNVPSPRASTGKAQPAQQEELGTTQGFLLSPGRTENNSGLPLSETPRAVQE